MLGSRGSLHVRAFAVAALLVPLALLGQGCEKHRREKPVEPADFSATTAESGHSPVKASAPAAEEADRPAAPRRQEPQRTRPTGPPQKTQEPRKKGPPAQTGAATVTESVTENTEQLKPESEKRAPAAETVHEKTKEPAGREQQGPSEERGAVTVTDANFAEVTGKGVALVDFWSERCPPCRMQGPIVEGLAKKFTGRATIGKLDVAAKANRRTPRKFRIMYIPTLIIFKDGREVKRFVGLQREAVLASALEEALKQK